MARRSAGEVFAERIRELIPEGEAAAYAAKARVRPEMLSQWRTGRLKPNLKLDTLERIAGALGRHPADLISDRPEAVMAGPAEEKGREWAYLPKVATAAAGEPIDFEHDDVDWYAFHQSWVEQMAGTGAVHDAQRVILVDIAGESMLPTIRDGALCVVDRGPHGGGVTELGQLHPERLYLVHDPDGGGVTVKRVAVDRERAVLALVPDNPDRSRFPVRFLPLHRRELGKVVIGTVVHVGQDTAPRQALPGKPAPAGKKGKADLVALVEAKGARVVK